MDWLKRFQLGFYSVLVFVCDIQQQRKDMVADSVYLDPWCAGICPVCFG
jgi:hypothetical protein